MALNFPPIDDSSPNPTDGLIWTAPTGQKWQYDASVPGWRSIANETGGITYRGGIDVNIDPNIQHNDIDGRCQKAD